MNFTPEHDQRIRELYTPPYVRGLISAQARAWGCPCGHVTHRARQLGLTKLSQVGPQRRWTRQEIQLARKNAHMTHGQLRRVLANEGYERSLNAIENFRLRDGWRSHCERDEMTVGYTALGLSHILGVDNTTVIRWIRLGLLKAQTEGGVGDQCARYRIRHHELYEFMVNQVHYWEPAKVDKYWLIDVLTQTNQRKLG